MQKLNIKGEFPVVFEVVKIDEKIITLQFKDKKVKYELPEELKDLSAQTKGWKFPCLLEFQPKNKKNIVNKKETQNKSR